MSPGPGHLLQPCGPANECIKGSCDPGARLTPSPDDLEKLEDVRLPQKFFGGDPAGCCNGGAQKQHLWGLCILQQSLGVLCSGPCHALSFIPLRCLQPLLAHPSCLSSGAYLPAYLPGMGFAEGKTICWPSAVAFGGNSLIKTMLLASLKLFNPG